MYLKLIALQWVAIFGFFSCEKQAIVQENTITLEANQEVEMLDGVSTKVVKIEDNRCPSSVTCIWAGEVKVYIFAKSDNAADTLLLKAIGPATGEDAPYDSISFQDHTILLNSVLPYPVTPDTPIPFEEYKVNLTVKKQ